MSNEKEASIKEKFEAAVFIVQNLPQDGEIKPSVNEKLNFYALYKQATIGTCSAPKPSFWKVQELYKWEAWSSLGELSADEAMERYVRILTEKISDVRKLNPEMSANVAADKNDPINKLLEPKMAVLGFRRDEDEAESTTSLVEMSAQSDCEYADALDDYSNNSRSSSFSKKRKTKDPSCNKIRKGVEVISSQLQYLAEEIERQHDTTMSLFKNSTVFVVVPRSVTWTQLFFFFIWPFIAHSIARLVRKLLTRLW